MLDALPDPRSRRLKTIPLYRPFTVALVGNPNAGKTTLFNALTGVRAKTANFPGTTVERRVGRASVARAGSYARPCFAASQRRGVSSRTCDRGVDGSRASTSLR